MLRCVHLLRMELWFSTDIEVRCTYLRNISNYNSNLTGLENLSGLGLKN